MYMHICTDTATTQRSCSILQPKHDWPSQRHPWCVGVRGWVGGWVGGWVSRWVRGWVGGCACVCVPWVCVCVCVWCVCVRVCVRVYVWMCVIGHHNDTASRNSQKKKFGLQLRGSLHCPMCFQKRPIQKRPIEIQKRPMEIFKKELGHRVRGSPHYTMCFQKRRIQKRRIHL